MLALPLLALLVLGPPEDAAAQPERVEVVAVEPPPPPTPPQPAPRKLAPGPLPPEPARTDPKYEPPPRGAPEPAHDDRDERWQAEIFVDIYYAFNSNSPNNHIMRGFVPAPRSGEVVPNVVGGFIRHRATDSQPWWFELGLHAGAGVDSLVAAEPIAGGEDGRFAGVEVFKHIALANLGFRIPKSKTSIGAGVLESPFGLSSFWSFRNTTYTPMWQNVIVPYYLVGARVSQEIPGGLTFSAWVVNGAQTYSDAYKVPSGVGSLSWTPKPRKGMYGLTINSHVLFGPERQSTAPADWYVLWDTTIVWQFDNHFSMAAAWDLAIERPGRAMELQNLYTGGGILARGCVLERKFARMDLVLRPDVLLDRDGHYLGVPQWLITPSASADLTLWERLMFRVQYRYDYSTNPNGYFYRGPSTNDEAPGLARSQHTVFLALTAVWDFWFGRSRE